MLHRDLQCLLFVFCRTARLPALPMLLSSSIISFFSMLSALMIGSAFNVAVIEFLERYVLITICQVVYKRSDLPERETAEPGPVENTGRLLQKNVIAEAVVLVDGILDGYLILLLVEDVREFPSLHAVLTFFFIVRSDVEDF